MAPDFLSTWRRFEASAFHKFCEFGPPPEILASIPAALHMNAPMLVASCVTTVACLNATYRKGVAVSCFAMTICNHVKIFSKNLKEASMHAMSMLHVTYGTDAAKKLLSYKFLKLTVDACDLIENFDRKKFFLFITEVIGHARHKNS